LIKFLIIFILFSSVSFAQEKSELLEVGTSSSNIKALKEIKFVSYNIRWRGGEDLKKTC